jgi:CheY-like chemotaxis protein
MPEMDGFEVLRQNRVAGGKVPIIAISGNPTNDHFLRMARMLGARHTLTKPISADLLISTVNETLAVSAQK